MHLPTLSSFAVAALLAGIAGVTAGSPLPAQSRGKVLTPPRPADSTARQRPPAATSAAPNASPGTPAAPAVTRAAPVLPQSPVLDSIREAVFRNLLERDRAGFATLASAFCLALSTDDFKTAGAPADRVDPSESMVRRVYTPRTPARRASGCTFSTTPSAARPVPGRPLLYTVGAIDLQSPTRAEAAAGYTYDGVSRGGYTFSLERGDSAWVVKQWRMEWTGKP